MIFISDELIYHPEGEEDSYVLIEFDMARRRKKTIIPIFLGKIDGTKIHSDFDEFYSRINKLQGINLPTGISSKKAAQSIQNMLSEMNSNAKPTPSDQSDNVKTPKLVNKSSYISSASGNTKDFFHFQDNSHNYVFSLYKKPINFSTGLLIRVTRTDLIYNKTITLFEYQWSSALYVDASIKTNIDQDKNVFQFTIIYDVEVDVGTRNDDFIQTDSFNINNPFDYNIKCHLISANRVMRGANDEKSVLDWAKRSYEIL